MAELKVWNLKSFIKNDKKIKMWKINEIYLWLKWLNVGNFCFLRKLYHDVDSTATSVNVIENVLKIVIKNDKTKHLLKIRSKKKKQN